MDFDIVFRAFRTDDRARNSQRRTKTRNNTTWQTMNPRFGIMFLVLTKEISSVGPPGRKWQRRRATSTPRQIIVCSISWNFTFVTSVFWTLLPSVTRCDVRVWPCGENCGILAERNVPCPLWTSINAWTANIGKHKAYKIYREPLIPEKEQVSFRLSTAS